MEKGLVVDILLRKMISVKVNNCRLLMVITLILGA
jgi:hypothetical protein